ncbi:MAG TPA: hypothetical protein VJL35_12160 [Gemmatimonadaceae bacterium]|nr:hypothetical protein [Gemmatimonadaceae bacterium]
MRSEMMMLRRGMVIVLAGFAARGANAQIKVNPTGVNVNTNGATTAFLTFGGLGDFRPVEAEWCGELVSAAPAAGLKCDPSTVFGRLPIRFDQSRLSGVTGFTDIMSIPPSVARRAYQAAETGQKSSFFYVRRFRNPATGQEQYVAVTCRLAGGGARVPFSLVDVSVKFNVETPILFIKPGEGLPQLSAQIFYNGTGRLKGRWEIVRPGEEIPSERDLLTEATLPVEERGTQRRYTELERFNIFLPPTGQYLLRGPDVSRIATTTEGVYLILLRIEASDDKEGDSNLGAAGAGTGIVHAGAVAGFPMPPLRYVVGAGSSELSATERSSQLTAVSPIADAALGADAPIDFSWTEAGARSAFYKVEIRNPAGEEILAAIVPRGPGLYRAPSWIREQASATLRWRVIALDLLGREVSRTEWRQFSAAMPASQ